MDSEGGVGSWSSSRICASAGDLNVIYRRSTSVPSTPCRTLHTDTLLPTGWADDVSGTTGDSQLYGSVGHRGAESPTWSFSAPFPVGGTSYREKTVYRVKTIEDGFTMLRPQVGLTHLLRIR